jgi:4'-phosphopantetheinyl transferase
MNLQRCESLEDMLALAANEVRVWEIALEEPPLAYGDLWTRLTDDERVRAERYRVERPRQQFVIARGLLRTMLGRFLGQPPERVQLAVTGVGKPILAGVEQRPHFNVSHTDGLALIAVAHWPVGVDVERMRAITDPDGLVARFFSTAERDSYRSLPGELKQAGFFRGWTSKEAVIKAVGLSVSCLDEFDVELDPRKPARLSAARLPRLAGSAWGMVSWRPRDGYAATVALEGVREVTLLHGA